MASLDNESKLSSFIGCKGDAQHDSRCALRENTLVVVGVLVTNKVHLVHCDEREESYDVIGSV